MTYVLYTSPQDWRSSSSNTQTHHKRSWAREEIMAVSSLVSCEWLKEQMDGGASNIRILDGHWNNPVWKRNAAQEYLDAHIEGAVRFDIATVADKSNKQPLMLPPPEEFAEHVSKMGISNNTHVVVYDNQAKFGFYSAGRVWWMFRIMGHEKVSLLDGGIPKWISKGYPVVQGPQAPVPEAKFTATFNPDLLRDLEQVKKALETKCEQVADGRPKGRFDGTAPEPNPNIHSGHMLGALSVPFMNLIDPDTKILKDKEGIKQAFESAGIDVEKPMLVTCGGAITACMLAFGLYQLGKSNIPVYDGSWADWVKNAPDETKHLGVKGADLQQ